MKSKISKLVSAVGFALLAPLMPIFAQNSGDVNGAFFDNIIKFINKVIKAAFPIVTAVLILLFGYQLIMFLWGTKSEPEEHEKFRRRMIQSFIAILMWFILFGLITVVAKAIGVNVGDTIQGGDIPSVCLTPPC